MDGNNSVKRIASVGAQDAQVFNSEYFLSHEQVDCFKDEVKHTLQCHDHLQIGVNDNVCTDFH